MLWGSLGLSLLVLVAGAFLVPALSLPEALLAILVGGIFGNALLGGAAAIGAEAGVPAMVLLRAPLGRAGSYLPTGLNVLQNLGWTIFEVLVIATAAHALVHGPLWVWKLAAAAAATILALLGPIGFVRVWVKRVALWVVLASLVYLTWWTLHDADLGALWSQPGKGGLSFWQGVDLVVAMPVSWLPLAADYTRFSRSGRGAFWGSAVGYFIPNVWLYALGAILLLSRGLADAPSVITAIATGGVGAALALVALGIDETKEPFANIYSAAVSVQNVLPRVPQRLLILAVAAVATAGTFVDRSRELPELPLPAGLVLRAAVRRAARAVDRGRARPLCRSAIPPGTDRGLARRLLPLPVARAGRAELVDPPRRSHPSGPGGDRRLAAELRPRLRAVARPYACESCERSP